MRKKELKLNPKYICKGAVKITKENVAEWKEKLKDIRHITGDLSINSNVTFSADNLKSVGGYLSINSNVNEKLERQLWKYNFKNRWRISGECSAWLLAREGKIEYYINHVQFDKPLFDSVCKGTLSAQEVFAITNMEPRRVAYEKMDKTKMRELPNLTVLDKIDDDYGFPMQLISFRVDKFSQPFKFLNCTDPSTGREYFLECFNSTTCLEAKAKSFGLDEKIKFTAEW